MGVKELGCLRRRDFELHHDVGCGAMGFFEFVSRRPNVRWARQSSSGNNLMLAHIGEALNGLFEGKGRLGGLGDAAQDMVKRAERFLGLGTQRRLGVEVSSWAPAKGDTIAVLVSLHPHGVVQEIFHLFRKNPHLDPEIQVMYDGCEVPVFPIALDSKLWRALVPTTPLTTPGPRALKVEINDGRREIFEGSVEVMEKEYPVESIWLPKTKSKIRGTAMEKEKVRAFIATVSENQIWNGPFVLPSDGEITTGYGLQRYYDGVFAEHYYHRGVDYGDWEGDPVRAPANGRVALVGKEKDGYEIHGNCVGLDHGHGVTSIMMHLNSSFVKEGEMVQAGQIIGTVGETGIATGPHLHWGLHVRGEAVDPQPWMQDQKWI